ncbi:DUF2207 domain-containing protein [Clostridium sp. 'deep sea']|uniref:DUF2207 domain-containing protein n=1 Tax=Clostridium sp. 'deep sea' TaxID=2779445 RepID=UPI0018969A56|nr:DUF2207 domain-containing protein [Clostridium sp. 'deep sea']QOR35570.1 DUF2207 domain-containing protein [Clostridium sp. 'deep sea']
MNRKSIKVLMLAIVILLTFQLAFATDDYEIDTYHVEITVNDDNSYDIVEKIEANFKYPKHGIKRDIPTSNKQRRNLIKDIKVEGAPYDVNAKSNYVSIKIGDPDEFVRGKQNYNIKYHYIVGKDLFNDYDEFYYNIIGTEWDTTINNVTFTITMPKDFDESKVNITSGYRGSESTSKIDYQVNGNIITGKVKGSLRANEGVTIALNLPEGYYENVKDLNKVAGIIKVFAYIASAILIALAYFSWRKHGRDRELFAPVQFYPPNGMTSAEIGYIIDGVVDNKDITSLIILWASKGYLKIIEGNPDNDKVEKSKDFTLVKLKEADDSMRMYEQIMFKRLFDSYGDGNKVSSEDLKNSFYEVINSTKNSVAKHFKGNNRLYTSKSSTLKGLYHLLSIVPCILMLYAILYPAIQFSYSKFVYILAIFGVSVLISFSIAFFMRVISFREQAKPGLGFTIKSILGVVFSVVPALAIGYILSLVGKFSFVNIAFMILACATVNLFAFIMTQRTEYGIMCSEQILGFKDFLEHAEKDRLEVLVDENPEYFYNTLAYAMVLGVSDKWAKKFEKIALEPPSWYQGYYGRAFTPYLFHRRLTRSFTGMQNTMTSMPAPKSGGGKSSFGGGSVGGGSGGGGGSSW